MNGPSINEKFEEIYSSKILPQLNNLENYRLNKLKIYNFFSTLVIISIIIIFVSMVILYITKDNINPITFLIIFISFILTFICSIIIQKIDKSYRQKIKQSLLPHIFSLFGKFYLSDNANISLNEIKSLGLYPKANTKKDDDIIVGTYKNIPITLIETNISQTIKNNNSSNINSNFNGLILKIKTQNTLPCSIVAQNIITLTNFKNLLKEISKKDASFCSPKVIQFLDNPMFNFLEQTQQFMRENKLYLKNGRIYIDIFNKRERNKVTKQLEEINLEDSDFNKMYKIFTDDQVEARYILSPVFMEKLKNIQAVFLCLSLDFVFKDDEIYFFLGNCINMTNPDNNNHGFFEVSNIKSTIFDKNKYNNIFKELIVIFSLINYFNIENKQ